MRLTILSRASDLARIQATLVARAIQVRWPEAAVTMTVRRAAGDLDTTTPLAQMPDKGAFTADLSDALARGDADLVVHSWKDLPLDGRPDTVIAATLPRADPRDMLIVRREAIARAPSTLSVFTSSPRRAWLLDRAVAPLLPWSVDRIAPVPVRGNVPTRVRRLVEGHGDALVVAKAALDRLLGSGVNANVEDGVAPDATFARDLRGALADCRWMVLPLRDVPGAPAQGALAVEVAATNGALIERLGEISDRPTWSAVTREREFLASHGGGCHAPIAATVLHRDYGVVTSAKAQTSDGIDEIWSLESARRSTRAAAACVWPRPEERDRAARHSLAVDQPATDRALWVARADAVPPSWTIDADRVVWAAGTRTWRRLAARGIWVNGCADGLGDTETPGIDAIAGCAIRWLRLTHSAATGEHDLATYSVETHWPGDLSSRTHFFWTSGTEFRRAIARFPEIAPRHHASGPGRTAQAIRETLGDARGGVWLDYDAWYQDICR